MKRDFELIRKMIFALESGDHDGWMPDDYKIPGYSQEQIDYHTYLLVDGGLAYGEKATQAGHKVVEYFISRLTWAGHEFVELASDESRWRKAMGIFNEGGGITFAELSHVLVALLKTKSAEIINNSTL